VGVVKKLTWFLPGFPYVFYGGVHTILRFADFFQRAHGVTSTFILPPPGEESVVRGRIAKAFPDLASASQILVPEGPSRLLDLEPADAGVATEWSTAYDLLRFNNVRRKFYFVQDDESLFYPAGSKSAFAEATCRFGFAGICNSIGVRDRYLTRGGTAEYFDPCVDTSVFNLRGRESEPRARDVSTLFCYMRPSHSRNCFELLADALRLVKSRLGKKVRILSAGADWGPKSYGLEGVLENLGLLGYRQTATLYRKCDAGLVMMMTCHPSYLPLELMACGALVISNRNPHTGWLLQDRVNCLLAEASPSRIADAVEEGLEDRGLRERLIQESHRLVLEQYSRWDEQAEKIYQYMCSQS
jgi:glycosyltransferase involved in cell wall biosynthesis